MNHRLIEARKRTYLGKRVAFVSHVEPENEPHPLTPGEQGLVTHVDDNGTLLVEWDSGRALGILVDDTVRIVE